MTTWKDIVKINGKFYGVEKEIPSMHEDGTYHCEEFFKQLSEEFSVDLFEISTVMFDGIDIPREDIERIGYGEESCGAYVDGELQYYS